MPEGKTLDDVASDLEAALDEPAAEPAAEPADEPAAEPAEEPAGAGEQPQDAPDQEATLGQQADDQRETEQSAAEQPAVEPRPTVTDDGYVPSRAELPGALGALVADVPDSAIPMLWGVVRAFVEQAANSVAEAAGDTSEDVAVGPPPEALAEAVLAVERVISEADDDVDYLDVDAFVDSAVSDLEEVPLDAEDLARASADEGDDGDDEDTDEDVGRRTKKTSKRPKRKNVTAGDTGMSLGDIAKELGFSGPSGVKNMLYRIERKLKHVMDMPEEELDELLDVAAQAYIDELVDAAGGNLDDDDLEFLDGLRSHPDVVRSLPEFRDWFSPFLDKLAKGG